MASDDLNGGKLRKMPDPVAGGKASGEARRRKANLRAAGLALLSGAVTDAAARNVLKLYGYNPDDSTNADVVMLMQLQKAARGDTSAAIFLRDTTGQSPTAKTEISIDRPSAGADLRLLSDADLQKLIDNE